MGAIVSYHQEIFKVYDIKKYPQSARNSNLDVASFSLLVDKTKRLLSSTTSYQTLGLTRLFNMQILSETTSGTAYWGSRRGKLITFSISCYTSHWTTWQPRRIKGNHNCVSTGTQGRQCFNSVKKI